MIKYPARYEKESEAMYSLGFIDFPGAITQGKDMEELHHNGQDVLSLAIKFNLDRDLDIPEPSQIEGDDIILVEPFPEIRQRMGHKKGCECPVCQNARGDRKKEKERFEVWIPRPLKMQTKQYCRDNKISEGKLVTQALEKYLSNPS